MGLKTIQLRFANKNRCLEFVRDHPHYLSKNNSLQFLSDNGGESYNLCHCKSSKSLSIELFTIRLDWSNFEIADMDFWRSEAYQKFFEFLESSGGFYYEVEVYKFRF